MSYGIQVFNGSFSPVISSEAPGFNLYHAESFNLVSNSSATLSRSITLPSSVSGISYRLLIQVRGVVRYVANSDDGTVDVMAADYAYSVSGSTVSIWLNYPVTSSDYYKVLFSVYVVY